ncbi:MAG: YbaN family protein, partial [Leptolinea sp.]
MNRLRTNLFILLGTICVIFGVIGMALPILPTTPFLLLAAFFYARSSKRFYSWLMTNRIFGEYLRNFREGRGIPLRQKVIVIGIFWLTIG